MSHAWRLFKTAYAATDLLGEGSRLFGGRLNSKGTAVVYTSGSLALAAFETLVHVQSVSLLTKYHMRRLTFDDRLVITVSAGQLPPNWRDSPPPAEIQRFGDQWVAAGRSPILRVPSALLPQEDNFILNPAHPDFAKIVFETSEPFVFPPRIVDALKA